MLSYACMCCGFILPVDGFLERMIQSSSYGSGKHDSIKPTQSHMGGGIFWGGPLRVEYEGTSMHSLWRLGLGKQSHKLESTGILCVTDVSGALAVGTDTWRSPSL